MKRCSKHVSVLVALLARAVVGLRLRLTFVSPLLQQLEDISTSEDAGVIVTTLDSATLTDAMKTSYPFPFKVMSTCCNTNDRNLMAACLASLTHVGSAGDVVVFFVV